MNMKIGLLQSTEICYNSINYFLTGIERALNTKSIQTQWIKELTDDVLIQKWDAMIGINNSFPAVKLEDGSFLMDFFECPVFDILVDPPYYHHSILESHMEKLHVIVLDQGHVAYCQKYYPSVKTVEMAYLLGAVGEAKEYEDKKIDILFTGSLVDEETIKRQAIETYNAEWATAILKLLIQNGMNQPDFATVQVLKTILEQNGISYTDDALKSMMNGLGTYAEFYLRGYWRRKIITTLVDAGLKVHVAGNGWDKLYSECPENLVLLGSMDFAQMAELTADAKIVLNVMPWFKDGIHDRIPTTMLNGSLCVTDNSSYIESHFEDEKELVIFELNNIESLPARLSELLEDTEKMKSIIEVGRKKAEGEYSWELFVDNYILKHL